MIEGWEAIIFDSYNRISLTDGGIHDGAARRTADAADHLLSRLDACILPLLLAQRNLGMGHGERHDEREDGILHADLLFSGILVLSGI